MKRRVILHLVFAILACAIPCSCSTTDPNFDALLATAETNPNPDAILGMWHRRIDNGGNWAIDIKSRTSWLFTADGKCVTRNQTYIDGQLQHYSTGSGEGVQLTWEYGGDGLWRIKKEEFNTNIIRTFRISNGKLLELFRNGGTTAYRVFNRVN